MSRSNKAALSRENRNTGTREELTLHDQEVDTPVLPVEQMAQLHQFRPDIIDWILKQTEMEAESRRNRQENIDRMVSEERSRGQIFGFLIGIAGIIGGSLVAVFASAAAGGTIASIAIGTLAVAFLKKT